MLSPGIKREGEEEEEEWDEEVLLRQRGSEQSGCICLLFFRLVLPGGSASGRRGKEGGCQGRREDLKLIRHSYLDTEGCQVKCTTFLVPH